VPTIKIGTLSLEVPGLSPEEGRRLAERVAFGLSGVEWPQTPPDRVAVTVEAGSTGVDDLATIIVGELRRHLV
jgi:hypothetical protein